MWLLTVTLIRLQTHNRSISDQFDELGHKAFGKVTHRFPVGKHHAWESNVQ